MPETTNQNLLKEAETITTALETHVSSLALASISQDAQGLLLRMFSNPYLLEKEERASLVSQLRECVAQFPASSELRVLLGMAMCVNFDAQSAIEELRESVRLAPDSFIAQLKFGELWMRLRVIDQAEEHTLLASKLARNPAQSEIARRQASSIRTMKREGIERGGYGAPLQKLVSSVRRAWTRRRSGPSVALELS
jgi:predicted Zn-dependent protease